MHTESANPHLTVWFNDAFVPLAQANVSVLTHALHYGTALFEGIRGYWEPNKQELHLVRMREHFERWKRNANILRIAIPASVDELCEITAELCRRNGFRSHVYVRPLAYKSAVRIGVPPDEHDSYSISVLPLSEYLSGKKGVTAAVSSWRRIQDHAIPCRAKICGAYVNSVLAVDEARRNGHDEAIFLNEAGHVAEGATSNLFMVRNGRLITPAVTDNILEGITRASVMELARKQLNLEVVERSIDRSELYVCDELFFTGTAVEVTPVLAVDHRPVGSGEPGTITQKLRNLYIDATRGRLPGFAEWLWPVYSSARSIDKIA
ncbi:MAG TPA: branched-chain amino acid transaminase [Bryobacteraceae bacterium]|jgi:branched-chain amino acid aminotransferase|nr:branched-chain amino acid transaminase [Bryobacteraceae bacterium]